MNVPYILKNREYESPLWEFRLARYLSLKELGKMCGCCDTEISNLQTGMAVPYYLQSNRKRGIVAGQMKPHVEKMAKILGASLAELFPRYICDIRRFNCPDYLEIMRHFCSDFSRGLSQDRLYIRLELMKVLATLTPREEAILRFRFGFDGQHKTLESLARLLNVKKERVRQIEARALRKLRHPSRSRTLRDLKIEEMEGVM